MQRTDLDGAGFSVSRLGFGLAGLMGAGGPSERQRLLGRAFDLGVTHFDAARLYGAGLAESELGVFLHGRRDQVTVTTKFGLDPAPLAVTAASRLLGKVGLRGAGQVIEGAARPPRQDRFSPERARQSLETSLRALRTEVIDLWLAHEATAAEITPELTGFLEAMRDEGKIRAFGVGTDFANIAGLHANHPGLTRIVQFENSVLTRNIPALPPGERAVITHRAVGPAFGPLRDLLASRADLLALWSARLDLDLSDPSQIRAALLAYALTANPHGVVLFSTRSPGHLEANIAAVERPVLTPEQAADFARLVAEAVA